MRLMCDSYTCHVVVLDLCLHIYVRGDGGVGAKEKEGNNRLTCNSNKDFVVSSFCHHVHSGGPCFYLPACIGGGTAAHCCGY